MDFDHDLPPSSSYIYPSTSFPTTPSLLSRQSSMSRIHPSRSHSNVVVAALSPQPLASITTFQPSKITTRPLQDRQSRLVDDPESQRRHHHRARSHQPQSAGLRALSPLHINNDLPPLTIPDATDDPESSWLLRTASSLTLSRMEEKGQSWLVARESSTSLRAHADADDEYYTSTTNTTRTTSSPAQHRRPVDMTRGISFGDQSRSRRNSQVALSKAGRSTISRPVSRRNSFRAASIRHSGTRDMTSLLPIDTSYPNDRKSSIPGPDFVNEEDEAEARRDDETTHLAEALRSHDSLSERELKKVVLGRVGGWLDWAVGWMDFRQDYDGDGDDNETETETERERNRLQDNTDRTLDPLRKSKKSVAYLDVDEVARRLDSHSRTPSPQMHLQDGDDAMQIPAAPTGQDIGILGDAKWLLALAGKVALK